MTHVNVVCVNWGTKYSADYVHKLYRMVSENTTRDFQFFCLTDQQSLYEAPIHPVTLEPGFEGWWNKMQLFKDGVLPDGEYLYFDLDVVIVDNIDCLFDFEGFGITRDFVNPDKGLIDGKEYNSSIMRFTQDAALWDFFEKNQASWREAQQKIGTFGDQNVISAYLNRKSYQTPFPDEWIWSFKVGTIRGRRPLDDKKIFGSLIPVGGRVCVFHGRPNPSEVDIGWVKKHWSALSAQDPCEQPAIQIDVRQDGRRMRISVNNTHYNVDNHWFWPEFEDGWEPQTLSFFKNNLIDDTDYLDIGGWIGPTAVIATSIGARKVKVVEPNPMNFMHLLRHQFNNPDLFKKWALVNACVANSREPRIIGPIEGIASASSATNIRQQSQEGAEVISLKIMDLIQPDENYSLIKIDIEGAEAFIIPEIEQLADNPSAIWLSLHPPFYEDKQAFWSSLKQLEDQFLFTNEHNQQIDCSQLKHQVLTDQRYPEWGTKWGNFFEIGLLPKRHFTAHGSRL